MVPFCSSKAIKNEEGVETLFCACRIHILIERLSKGLNSFCLVIIDFCSFQLKGPTNSTIFKDPSNKASVFFRYCLLTYVKKSILVRNAWWSRNHMECQSWWHLLPLHIVMTPSCWCCPKQSSRICHARIQEEKQNLCWSFICALLDNRTLKPHS